MNIIHYALGFPPYRRGGLTKYCLDLAETQVKAGNKVTVLWPGEMGILYNKRPGIKVHSDYCINGIYLGNVELTGILPVPLLEGVKTPRDFMREVSPDAFRKFIIAYKPDVFHIHTIMGLPIEYLNVLKELSIKIIYTTHDYYGICFRTTFVKKDNSICSLERDCSFCCMCNSNAMSTRKLTILQSSLYRAIKESPLIKIVRREHFQAMNSENQESIEKGETGKCENLNEYKSLLEYYKNIFSMIDVMLFNSSVTESVFKNFIPSLNGVIMGITNSAISDNKKQRHAHTPVQVSYLGPKTTHKGYYVLKEACEQLLESGYSLDLNVYFQDEGGYIKCNSAYAYSELGDVMDRADVVVVPSQWYETFGFITLEALSYGVPVIVSENVGSKDLIKNNEYGFITSTDYLSIAKALERILINPDLVQSFSSNIKSDFKPKTMQEHCKEIIDVYRHG